MHLFNRLFIVVVIGLSLNQAVLAGDAEDRKKVMESIARLNLDAKPDEVTKSIVPGFYEARYGMRFLYVSVDGKYIFHGDLLSAEIGDNLSEMRRGEIRMSQVNQVPESEMIIFEPKTVKRTITVFTDIDCGFCRRMHSHIDDFLAQGVRVRYLLTPRSGIGSPSYKKAVAAWCSKDQNKALTEAKRGALLDEKTCDNPIQKHMAVGEAIGLQGTPTILTEDGTHIGGYLSPAQLQVMLAARPPRQQASKK